jgi:hypothetical protein
MKWSCSKKDMWDPNSYCNIVFLTGMFVYCIYSIIQYINAKKEAFGSTSPGTMVQLQTSHVPTEEDEFYWRTIYPRIVRKEIYNMTESDL